MTNVVEQSVEIDAPVSKVFAYVDDFTTTKDWMYGLTRIDPVTEQLSGVGAQYDGVMKVGVPLKARIQCTSWERDRLIELTSVKGIQTTQRWSFTDLGGDRTRVDAWVSYTLPGGPAGKAIAAAVKPVVGIAVKHTSEALVRNVESL
ncbi:putative membrane protein [Nocardioides aromaticivorans]|uniref:Putative membrane protein n=1 Tax=Nocardioides aromaticivorans TaxID=200618 RepID=A0A7Z0CPP7_9ACTN|nr:SRPBCC family protein [Nocardioides aromaticivorans]NYI46022.1 putative membrane protein [Nocardioides aromaticivorans]